ncbi:MAG: PAS domain S-box protein [Nitrosomonas sp. PRO4]|nr:PAS domain S-box protein [Nitrosomonas sp. PRO4]
MKKKDVTETNNILPQLRLKKTVIYRDKKLSLLTAIISHNRLKYHSKNNRLFLPYIDDVMRRASKGNSINCETLPVTPVDHPLQTRYAELLQQNQALRENMLCLEELFKHYQSLYHFAPVGYLTLSMEGEITEINRSALHFLDTKHKDLIGHSFMEFLDPECQPLWIRHFNQAKVVSQIHGCELPFYRRHGKIDFIRLDCRRWHDGTGNGWMRITMTDVTKRKQAEEALRSAAIAFETKEGVMITDADKKIVKINKSFTRLTGYSAEDAIGNSPSFLQSGQHRLEHYEKIWKGINKQGYWQGEIWDRHKNGKLIPILLTISKVTNKARQVTHYVGNFVDITMQKQTEKRMLEDSSNLERQLTKAAEKLVLCEEEITEANRALDYLFKHQEKNRANAQLALSNEMDNHIHPLLKKLKTANKGRRQSIKLLKILESGLMELTRTYGSVNSFTLFQKLSPAETQVAAMIKSGQSTKIIAAALSVSPGTVNNHRKQIRKKLGLDSRSTNLRSFLQSLEA